MAKARCADPRIPNAVEFICSDRSRWTPAPFTCRTSIPFQGFGEHDTPLPPQRKEARASISAVSDEKRRSVDRPAPNQFSTSFAWARKPLTGSPQQKGRPALLPSGSLVSGKERPIYSVSGCKAL